MTPEEQIQYIADLKADIAILKAFKESLMRRQINFPLDRSSQNVIHQDLMVPTGNVVVPYSLASYTEQIEVQDRVTGKKYYLVTTPVQ